MSTEAAAAEEASFSTAPPVPPLRDGRRMGRGRRRTLAELVRTLSGQVSSLCAAEEDPASLEGRCLWADAERADGCPSDPPPAPPDPDRSPAYAVPAAGRASRPLPALFPQDSPARIPRPDRTPLFPCP